MSKVDAMQAMREARYAARAANKTVTVPKAVAAAPRGRMSVVELAPAVDGGPVPPVPPVPPVAADPVVAPVAETEVEAQEALCGHRSMNNRLCRRPAGHSEKNHRYS